MEVEWIPCEERMPAPDVMVWLGNPGELRGLAYLDGWERDCWWLGDDESIPLAYATHWAEADLPDPPIEEAGDTSEPCPGVPLVDGEGNEVRDLPEPPAA
ncbi:MAG TPA: DUF551 domain-containing protein [Anaerolineae bacterium]|nr:DUF551 domain-containing protein [Anaerolineae bacterium]HUW13357.1 DUF551 domain-containing protein [Anaerolineae bacterium]